MHVSFNTPVKHHLVQASGTTLQIACATLAKSCLADPDLWYKPEVGQEDRLRYYSYVLLYGDDSLCIHHLAEEDLNKIDKFFKMKAGSIQDPDIYLGSKVKPMKMNNGVTAWALSPSKYVNEAINKCEKWIQENMPEHKDGC